VLTALHGWELSFAELRASLGGVNPRSLTLALKGMVAAGLVEREVLGGFPPTTSYRLTRAGEAYAPPLARVAGRK
jgi:DNA-binding HxlR family transcriptional regulator